MHLLTATPFPLAATYGKYIYLNLRRNDLTLNPSISRILLCLLSLFNLSTSFSQDNGTSSIQSVEAKKNAAIRTAKAYLETKFSNQETSRHFVADSTSSFIVCEDYKTFFSSTSAYCLPVGFEITFHVALNGGGSLGMLHSHLFLPVDSSLSVLTDSLDDVWRHGFFESWEKVITNKYKVNYCDVLKFAKQKNLYNYEIDFSFEKKSQRNFKFYWFLTEGSVLYQINPETGAVKKKKLLPLKIFEDVSHAANIGLAQAGLTNIGQTLYLYSTLVKALSRRNSNSLPSPSR